MLSHWASLVWASWAWNLTKNASATERLTRDKPALTPCWQEGWMLVPGEITFDLGAALIAASTTTTSFSASKKPKQSRIKLTKWLFNQFIWNQAKVFFDDPYRKDSLRWIMNNHWSNAVGGGKWLTMVVMFVGCLKLVITPKSYYSYCSNSTGWECFLLTGTLIAVKLLTLLVLFPSNHCILHFLNYWTTSLSRWPQSQNLAEYLRTSSLTNAGCLMRKRSTTITFTTLTAGLYSNIKIPCPPTQCPWPSIPLTLMRCSMVLSWPENWMSPISNRPTLLASLP